ncbi:MAG: DUF2384 domain-containing protein [Gemmatimonadota bacterium]|nr:DUF2384 domain-containing protein [Gemmatimonadota bacterium]MDE2983781.1 DUF2384 domain-containing protein [Gemmatimonadota bacterium]
MNEQQRRSCAYDPADLPARLVREARPVYGDPASLEELRHVVETGLPVEAVKVLQAELKRFGVRRASEFVNRIVPRATRKRRKRLKREEGEAILRVAATVALAVYVWGEEEGAAEFLTLPHPMLGGAVPIELALSEVGVRQVEDMLWGIHYGLPI